MKEHRKTVTGYLTTEEGLWLEKLAKENETTQAELIRIAVGLLRCLFTERVLMPTERANLILAGGMLDDGATEKLAKNARRRERDSRRYLG